MEKLTIPKDCVIRGQEITIRFEGDIVIENDLIPLSVKSDAGNLRYAPEADEANFGHLAAENGLLELSGHHMTADFISAQSAECQVQRLELSQAIQVKSTFSLKGGQLHAHELHAGELHLELSGNMDVEHIEVEGAVELILGSAKLKSISARTLVIRVQSKFECDRVQVTEKVVVESGHVSIRFMDAPVFAADPSVKGIVMMATTDDIRAEGVRGFIKPDEFKMLADQGAPLAIEGGSTRERDSAWSSSQGSQPEMVTQPIETLEMETLDEQIEDITDEEEMAFAVSEEEDLEQELSAVVESDSIESELDVDADELVDMSVPDMEEPTDMDAEGESEISEEEPVELGFDRDTDQIETVSLEQEIVDPDMDDEEVEPTQALTEEEQDASLLDVQVPPEEIEALPEIEEFDEFPELGQPDISDSGDAQEDEDVNQGPESLDSPEEYVLDRDSEAVFHGLQATDELDWRPGEEEDLSPEEHAELNQMGEEYSEEALVQELNGILNEIRSCFPDDNFPKFINQIQNYLDERRFTILRKQRNKEAVLSSFDRLNHSKISMLARQFYSRIDDFFQD